MAEDPRITETQEFPDTLMGRMRRFMTHIGDNIDLVNFFGREKDWQKAFQFGVPFMAQAFLWLGGRFGGSNAQSVKKLNGEIRNLISKLGDTNTKLSTDEFQNMQRSLIKLQDECDRKKQDATTASMTVADTLNGFTLAGIALISSWIEKKNTVQLYGDYVRQERGLTHEASFKDLRHSGNPIVRETADYYNRKSLYRLLPNFLSFGRLVPLAVRLIAGKERYNDPARFGWAKNMAKNWDGILASIGGWAGYFLWYYSNRRTGSHYLLQGIWDKTEGFRRLPNRALDHGAQPGAEVTNGDINELYGNLMLESRKKGSRLPKFVPLGPNDPLTDRLFTQIANYLNYRYFPKLQASKSRIDLDDPDFVNTRFSFDDLLHLMGTGGVDVNDAIATAVRVETLARADRKTYDLLSTRLSAIKRPRGKDFATAQAAEQAMRAYIGTVEGEARAVLGEGWPPNYIRDIHFREAIVSSFLESEMGVKPQRARSEGKEQAAAPPQPSFVSSFAQTLQPAADHASRALAAASPSAALPAL